MTDLLLPQPSRHDLVQLQTELGKTASEMAELFGLADGRRWRAVISTSESKRSLDPYRYTITLLQLGRHPSHQVSPQASSIGPALLSACNASSADCLAGSLTRT